MKYSKLIQLPYRQLSDVDYLNKYVNCAAWFYSNEIYGIKSLDYSYLSLSPVTSKMLGFIKINHAIGLKDENVPCKIAEVANVFYSQDKEVSITRKDMDFLDIHEYSTGLAFLKTTKKIIANPNTNNVLGTLYYCTTFNPYSNLKTILDIHNIRFGNHSSMQIIKGCDQFKLTEIERDVLFCVCLGINSRKDIAYLLSAIYRREVSAITSINDAFRRLYQKLDCNSPTQLLEFAEYNNLNSQIPQSFLRPGSYILN